MRCLREIRRQEAELAEWPVARFMALYANAHLPEGKQPFDVDQFRLFLAADSTPERMTAATAAAALSLFREGSLPPMLAAVMPEVQQAAKPGIEPPTIRAFHSKDDSLWLIAPAWEGNALRVGLAGSASSTAGPVLVHDLDRPILTYTVMVPSFPGSGWVEAGILLPATAT